MEGKYEDMKQIVEKGEKLGEILNNMETEDECIEEIQIANLQGKKLYLNGVGVVYRPSNGYIDVNELCKAGGKVFMTWLRLDTTTKFINELSSTTGLNLADLLDFYSVGNGVVYILAHPQIAINIAQWIRPDFYVKINQLVDQLQQEKQISKYKEQHDHQNRELKERDEKIEQMNTKVVLLKQEINLEKYINEICEQFRLKDSIDNYENENCLYILYIDKIIQDGKIFHIFKFGESSGVKKRMEAHYSEFKNLKIMHIIKVKNTILAQAQFKKWLRENEFLCKYGTHIEMFRLENEEQLFVVKNKIDKMTNYNDTMDETEILKLKLMHLTETVKQRNDVIKQYEERIKQYEERINQMERQYEDRINLEREFRLMLTSRLNIS